MTSYIEKNTWLDLSGLDHCLDEEGDLQDLFLGSEGITRDPHPPAVDMKRIVVFPRSTSCDMTSILMANSSLK